MNLLKEKPDYLVTRTRFGVRRSYLSEHGLFFSDFTSHRTLGGWPLVHTTRGRSPETGKVATARGIVAVGQKAVGFVAVGQACCGVVAIGQAAVGVVAAGQLAVGLCFGLGQLATGIFATGQAAVGLFGWAQYGLGPAALHKTRSLLPF